MTEIKHIEGLYAFWDELLARHPGLIIDNCAGGGQRIDLETISRSVPLSRSDLQCWPFDPTREQNQTQGLAPWVPLSAALRGADRVRDAQRTRPRHVDALELADARWRR